MSAAEIGDVAFQRARASYAAGEWPAAEAGLQQLAARDPGDAWVAYYLGKVAVQTGDYARAVALLEKAIAVSSPVSEFYGWLGHASAWAAATAPLRDKIGLGRKCLAAYRRAVELDPGNLSARMGLVNFYRHVPRLWGGGLERAHAEAAEILKRDVDQGTLALVVLHRHAKRYDEARANLAALQERHPESYTADYELGRLAAASGRWSEEGEAALRRCLRKIPTENEAGHDWVYWCLGQLAEARQELGVARRAYQLCLQSNPRHQQAIEALAHLSEPGSEKM